MSRGVLLGLRLERHQFELNHNEAALVRGIYQRYLELDGVTS